jgi:ABC-type sulfate/molybdate transport systems ATPase subunit
VGVDAEQLGGARRPLDPAAGAREGRLDVARRGFVEGRKRRALAVRPRVLLLEEPFGALDSRVRRELRRWLRRLHEALGEEALELADRVVVMDHGRIERIHAAGPTVKLELVTQGGGPVQAEISQEQLSELKLERGEEVWVRPRQKRVFAEDYSI